MIHHSGPPLAGGTGNDWSCLAGRGGGGRLSAPLPFPEHSGSWTSTASRKCSSWHHTCVHLYIYYGRKREEGEGDWSVLSGWQSTPDLEQHGLCEEWRGVLLLES